MANTVVQVDYLAGYTGLTLWDGSILTGGGSAFIFDSAAQANGGTKSIDATASVNNDEASIANGGSGISLSTYDSLSFAVYVTSWSTQGSAKDVQIRFRNNDLDVGDTKNLSDYIDTGQFNTWQNVIINKADLSLNMANDTVDELIFKTIDIGGGQPPDYYIDDIVLNPAGGGGLAPQEYIIQPPVNTYWILDALKVSMVCPLSTTLADASMHNLVYNKLLHLPALTNGLIFARKDRTGTLFAAPVRTLMDYLQGTDVDYQVLSDGTNTILTIQTDFSQGGLILDGKNEERLSITVNDNLSTFLHFRYSIKYRTPRSN